MTQRTLQYKVHSRKSAPSPVFIAAKAHSLLGDKERALDMLEDATKRREFWWPYFIVWDPIRSDPRFGKLVNRLGLPDAAHQ